MENNNKSVTVWKWSVLLLALLNIALLATIWLKPVKEGNGPPRDGSPAAFLNEQLHFTPDQVKSFDELRKVHHDSIELLREQSKTLHNRFFDNLKNPSTDAKTIDELAKAIADNQTQNELLTYHHFQKVRALCDDKQKATFDLIIGDVLKMMGPKGPRGQGPPPPPR